MRMPGKRDLTPLVDLLQGRALTGPARDRRPVYVDLLPPCNAGCPAGENIQAWLAYTEAGRHEQAWRQLVADNPMPAIHGRVCYHPCESACNRASLDSPVSIHAVERFLGDLALDREWSFAPPAARTGKRVPEAPVERRTADFGEVVGGLSEREATFEAGRCLSCGNCCECDGCLGACPEGAVIKLGPGHRYAFDYGRCTGCGACYEQCPVHAIEMMTERG